MLPVDEASLIRTASALAQPFVVGEECESGGVAAALATSAGNVYTGVCIDTQCSLGFCAEHAAVAEMLQAREADIRMIVAVDSDGRVRTPCGRCRELLWQLRAGAADPWVILGTQGEGARLSELLPKRQLLRGQ